MNITMPMKKWSTPTVMFITMVIMSMNILTNYPVGDTLTHIVIMPPNILILIGRICIIDTTIDGLPSQSPCPEYPKKFKVDKPNGQLMRYNSLAADD
jgi:hypothetical protein